MILSNIIHNISYSIIKDTNIVLPEDSNFMPRKVYSYIQNNYNSRNIYSFEVNTNKIRIYLYSSRNNANIYTWSIVFGVIKAFLLLREYNINNETIDIHYYPTPLKKVYNDELTPNEVNSGYTTFLNGGKMKYITIFREEEFHKVLLHEIIHYTNITSSKYSLIVDQIIMKETPFKNNIHFEEAFTDFLAIYHNTLYNGLIQNKEELVDEIIREEIKYQEGLVCYILKHYDFKEAKDIWKSKKSIYQETSVLSYYILKLGLFYNMEKVLENKGKTIKEYNELYELSKSGIIKHTNKLRAKRAKIGETSMRMTKMD